jgi:hypothetical protein
MYEFVNKVNDWYEGRGIFYYMLCWRYITEG